MNNKQRYATLENVRVVFDYKTNNIVLSSHDPRLGSGFMLTVKRGSPASESLKSLLIEQNLFDPDKHLVDKNFDGIQEILDTTDRRELLILGKRGTPRLKFALDITHRAREQGFSVLVIDPNDNETVSSLLWKVKKFFSDMKDDPSKPSIIVKHYETMNSFRRRERNKAEQYSYERAQRERTQMLEIDKVMDDIESYKKVNRTLVVGVGIGSGADNSDYYRFLTFPSSEHTKTKVLADNFRVGTKRLQNVMDDMAVNNYVMYAEGDLKIGTVIA